MNQGNRVLLACALFFLAGMLVQKSGLLRRAVYFVSEPNCSYVQSVLDNQCGNAICIYEKTSGDSQCLSEKDVQKVLPNKEEMVDQQPN